VSKLVRGLNLTPEFHQPDKVTHEAVLRESVDKGYQTCGYRKVCCLHVI
jgi:hypothetical protein